MANALEPIHYFVCEIDVYLPVQGEEVQLGSGFFRSLKTRLMGDILDDSRFNWRSV